MGKAKKNLGASLLTQEMAQTSDRLSIKMVTKEQMNQRFFSHRNITGFTVYKKESPAELLKCWIPPSSKKEKETLVKLTDNIPESNNQDTRSCLNDDALIPPRRQFSELTELLDTEEPTETNPSLGILEQEKLWALLSKLYETNEQDDQENIPPFAETKNQETLKPGLKDDALLNPQRQFSELSELPDCQKSTETTPNSSVVDPGTLLAFLSILYEKDKQNTEEEPWGCPDMGI